MSRYDGLIIPRSYSEYINKTDAATLQQALQLSGVLSGAVAAGDNKAVKSSAVNEALANYEKLYTSLSQLGISTSTTTLANVWDKLPNNAEAKLDKNLFTDTMPNTDSAFILFEKLNVARGKITYYTKDSNNTYLMCLNSSNAPSGTWEKLATESDLNKKLSNIPQAGTSLTDCDNAPIGFACNNKVAHTPDNTTGFVYILTLKFDDSPLYQYQMCFLISNNTIFTRVRINGTWENWASK